MIESIAHPADALGDIVAGGGDAAAGEALAALLAADREARVGTRWHAVVARHPDGDRVSLHPLPDLVAVHALLSGPVVLVDTETTGLHPHLGDRVTSVGIQAGWIDADAFREDGPGFERKVDPGRPSSPQALAVHGMGEAELSGKPPFRAIAGEVARRLAGRVLVAHNAPFDVDFLDLEFARTTIEGVTESAAAIVDTRVLAKVLWPGEPGGLDDLANRLGIDRGGRDRVHGALGDARLLGRCLPGLAAALALRLGIGAPSP